MKRNSALLLLCLLPQIPLSPIRAQGAEDEDSTRCIRLSRLDHTEVIDAQTIAFYLRNGDIYVNRLDRTCTGLDRGRPFSYRTSVGRLCDVDVITVADAIGSDLTQGTVCRLGKFSPASEEIIALLKGEEEPAEVTVTEIEVDE